MQVKVNFAGVLAHIAGKAAASGEASAESSLTDLKAAISSIDTFGAEGSQVVAAEEVCCSSLAPTSRNLVTCHPCCYQ